MGPKQKKIVILSWVISISFVFFWSLSDCLKVLVAVYRYPPSRKSQIQVNEIVRTDFRRSQQKYFLDYGIYVPLEDIMYVDQLPSGGERYADALISSCAGLRPGDGIAIWLPLKIKLPLIGEKVREWCWKPPTIR